MAMAFIAVLLAFGVLDLVVAVEERHMRGASRAQKRCSARNLHLRYHTKFYKNSESFSAYG